MSSSLKYIVVSLVLLLLSSSNVFSQKEKKEKKHELEYIYSVYNFFDGNKIIWGINPNSISGKNTGVKLAFGYKFHYADRYIFSFSADYVDAGYPCNQSNCHIAGDIISRRNYNFRTNFYYGIKTKLPFETYVSGGLVYRLGVERMFVAYPRWWELRSLDYPLNDLGASVGFRVSKSLSKRFTFSVENSYTYFVYRFDKGGNDQEYENYAKDFDNGSTKYMMNLDFRIGYFFKIKEAPVKYVE